MKKVLFVATVVKTHINVFHIPFLKMFHDAGWEVHVAAKNDFPEGEKCFIPYCDVYYDIPFDRSPLKKSNLRAYRMLKNIMKENQYDIVHCHTPVGGVLARLAGRNCKHTRMIYTAHGFHFYKGAPLINWLVYYPVERICAHYTDTLITINHEDYKRACKFHFRNHGNAEYVPGVGVNNSKFININVDKKKKRSEFKIPENAYVLLSVGELNKNKNHEIVIRSIAQIGNSQIHYIIAGAGNLKEYLLNLAQKLHINNQVHVLGFRNDVDSLYKISDIYIHPSLREGLPVALIEAMASGLPIISSNIRGSIDILNNDKYSYLISNKNINDLCENIIKILNNKAKAKSIIEGRKDNIAKYDMIHICGKMKEIYRIN